jgi:4-amino-4-deoxy-L-arabinose transferase-like glycosyltransferase
MKRRHFKGGGWRLYFRLTMAQNGPESRIETRRNSREGEIVAVLALLILGAGLAAWLWGKTGDIAGDFGQELAVAWQISRGKVLYRDLFYTFGPLGPYLSAAMFRLFGGSLNVILWLNVILLFETAAYVYRLSREMSGKFAAFVATGFFLIIFALSSPTRITNFNFLTPYSQDITIGFLLCLLTLNALGNLSRTLRLRSAIAAGVFTGLAILTKPEIALACAATAGLGLLAIVHTRQYRRAVKIFGAAALGIAIVLLAAFIFLATQMNSRGALAAIFNGWQFAGKDYVISMPFYRECLGIDHPAQNLALIVAMASIYAAACSGIFLVAQSAGKMRNRIWETAIGAMIAFAAFAIVRILAIKSAGFWIDADRGLVLAAIAAVLATGWRLIDRPREFDATRRVMQWSWAVLALALLPKMFLNVRTFHYGFVLAAPCTIFAILAAADYLPRLAARNGGSAIVVRCGITGILIGLAFNRVMITRNVLNERTISVPLAMGGTLRVRPEDLPSAQAIGWLQHSPANFTVGIFPESWGIAFAAGRDDPLKTDLANPMCVQIQTEPAILADLSAHRPDAILMVRWNTFALGARWFGWDYARDVYAWIKRNYQPGAIFGDLGQERSIQIWLKR